MNHLQTINTVIKEIFGRYSHPLPCDGPLTDITTCLDGSRQNDMVFYRLGKKQSDLKKFQKRLEEANSGIVVVNNKAPVRQDGCIINVGHSFEAIMTDCVDALYPVPEGKKYIGITGTNGKTSTTSFIAQMSASSQYPRVRTLTIGTLGVFLNGQRQYSPSRETTPSNIDLRKTLNTYKNQFDLCVLEASSHGLEQNRIKGVVFDLCIWTNLSRDHLDYHQDMESYYQAKLKIGNYLKPKGVVLIPSTAKELVDKKIPKAKVVPVKPLTDVPEFARIFFNQVNISLSLEALRILYGDFHCDLKKLKPVQGRASIFRNEKKTVIVDFAHTPDALFHIIQGVKELLKKKIILLFGAGGNRDQEKRKAMGEMACRYADFSYLTSDNPRDENPEEIIGHIVQGFSSKKFEIIPSRKKAIMKAVKQLKEDEVLIVTGKGHENMMEEQGRKYPFNDGEAVKEALGIRDV